MVRYCEAHQLRAQLRDEAVGGGVPADLEQPPVQQRVGVRGLEQVAGVEQPAHLGEDRAQVGDVLVGGVCARPGVTASPSSAARACRISTASASADQAHSGATVGLELDQALVLEPGQRGPHRRAPDAEAPRQIGLDQALVGKQLAGHDRGPQACPRAAPGRRFPNR